MENDIRVLMEDKCTRPEAIRHLKNGTVVYNISDEPWDDFYKDEAGISLSEIKSHGYKYDFSYVVLDGIEYVVRYCL